MSFSEIFFDHWRNLPILTTTETCKGATYIVTGSNTGIGFEAAKHLVRLGAKKVILAVRNLQAGEKAKFDIETATKTKGVAEVWQLDLASYASVKAFARRAAETLERIDALVENAGIALDQWSVAEGNETSVTVNLLSTLLLGVLLLPKMKESAQKFGILPHLVIVTSGLAFSCQGSFEKIRGDVIKQMNNKETADMDNRYGVTKLVQIYGILYLTQHLAPVSRTGVVINLLNPGLCKTTLTRHSRFAVRLQIRILRLLMGRTAEMGSRTILHAMVAGKESHGAYVGDCKIQNHQVPSWVTDERGKETQKQVWDEIARELEKIEPGCVEKIL